MSRRRAISLLILVCGLAVLACLLAYVYDNKYREEGPQATEGLLVLDEEALEQHPLLFLTEGWAYYSGRLLTPEDLAGNAPRPDAYVYIGQYGGFEAGGRADAPHGSASYRLRIRLPAAPRAYLLELPEIFSAYRLYVNGKLVAGMGEPDPARYLAETGNRTVSLEAGGEIELLLAVSDFSHLYSGMVYPPAFGEPETVSQLLALRLVLRGLVVAFALAVGLLSVLIGLLGGKNRLAALYGMLCLCFVGFSGYPLLRSVTSGSPALYAVEMLCFCAMLLVVLLLQGLLFGQPARWARVLLGLGVAMCVFSALLPLLLPSGSLAVMGSYSVAISAYELLAAAFITVNAARAMLRGQRYSMPLLCGFLVFDAALVMDRILPLYEPIVGGWFYESASFVLILCVGVTVGQEIAAKYRESAVLAERQSGMERLAGMQKASYGLLMEKVDEAKAIRHDMKHHFRMISGFLKERAYAQLSAYVAAYEAAVVGDEPLGYTQNVVVDVLLRHYAGISAERGIAFTAQAALGREAGVSDADLCALLSNLLENAVEACERMAAGAAFITLSVIQDKASLSILMENSADAASVQQRGAAFRSAKAEGRTGYGLTSVSATARRYGGEASFVFDADSGVFTSTVLLIETQGPSTTV